MKLTDRLWLLAHSIDYTEFARLWRRFGDGQLVDAARLAWLGTELHREVGPVAVQYELPRFSPPQNETALSKKIGHGAATSAGAR